VTDLINRQSTKPPPAEPMCIAPDNNYFSTRHGVGVTLSEKNTIVTATAQDNAVAYTVLPIPPGRLFQLKCLTPGTIVSTITACVLLLSIYTVFRSHTSNSSCPRIVATHRARWKNWSCPWIVAAVHPVVDRAGCANLMSSTHAQAHATNTA